MAVKIDQQSVKQALESALNHPVSNDVAYKMTTALQDMLDAVESKLEPIIMTEQEFKDRTALLDEAALGEQPGQFE